MTNEELCILIQNGDSGQMLRLWEQVERLITVKAQAFHAQLNGFGGIEVGDLIQSGYFAVVEAVRYYKPERGYRYVTYLTKTLQTAFRQAAGIRSSKRDPLNECSSLDMPLVEGSDTTYLDTVEDKTAQAGMEQAVESEYRRQLHLAMEWCLSRLPDDQREVIRDKNYSGLSLEQIAVRRKKAVQWARQTHDKGIRALRHPICRQRLRPFLVCPVDGPEYRCGYRSFIHSGASAVELAVERLGYGKANQGKAAYSTL